MILCDRLSKIQHIQNIFPRNKSFFALRVLYTCHRDTESILAVHIPEILPVLQVFELSPVKVICSNSHSSDHL